jgi:hypothetical protein
MTIKHFKKRPIEAAQTKTKTTPFAIVKKTKCPKPSIILTEMAEDKMSDDEFNKAMTALEDIWSACPEDLPKDLSTNHDYHFFREKK